MSAYKELLYFIYIKIPILIFSSSAPSIGGTAARSSAKLYLKYIEEITEETNKINNT